jgi:hypothetical protein
MVISLSGPKEMNLCCRETLLHCLILLSFLLLFCGSGCRQPAAHPNGEKDGGLRDKAIARLGSGNYVVAVRALQEFTIEDLQDSGGVRFLRALNKFVANHRNEWLNHNTSNLSGMVGSPQFVRRHLYLHHTWIAPSPPRR